MTNQLRVIRTRSRRTATTVGWLIALLAVSMWFAGTAASAARHRVVAVKQQTITVSDSLESWYSDTPTDPCSTAVGCPPAPLSNSAFADDTLHIGVLGGKETARSYVMPNLAAVPVGASYQASTMTLPVASDPSAGSTAPQTAEILGCRATLPPVPDAMGTSSKPPPFDVSTCVSVTYRASSDVFVLDITSFLTAWAGGQPADGIALVPNPAKTTPGSAWQVAFSGEHRAGFPHIRSAVTYQAHQPQSQQPSTPPSSPPSSGATGSTTGSAPGPGTATLPNPTAPQLPSTGQTQSGAGTAVAPNVAGNPSQTTQPTFQTVAFGYSFAYPLAFLVPIVMVGGAVFLLRLFTRNPLAVGPRR